MDFTVNFELTNNISAYWSWRQQGDKAAHRKLLTSNFDGTG
jgi:hypothetical protein